ncbi:uncharacterized protein LOC106155463 [Lingula anatina]|uniref:Uncharacterized protein LOC106155463 n=1 Tax=Lingula anatina TaxID=7574 RepID=A0A2R2MIP5_LINAN|nr:uncharacterized protein LOC106155463 [Lingula anatina]|eukprot:XP_023930101.1 uncharacterized protein LOC106155463 [Lingula anatina]
MFNEVSLCLSRTQTSFIHELMLAEDDIIKFEVQTRAQRTTPLWHKLRKGRITASNVGPIVEREKKKMLESLWNTIIAAMKSVYWIVHEDIAIYKFES